MARSVTTLALVGTGWAGRVHAIAASAAPNATVGEVAASTLGSAEVLAADLQVRAIIADRLPGRSQGVVIATPPSTHASLATRLLAAGTPVLIEKPLAATLGEADAIIAAADASGAAACYAENLLFSPVLDRARNRREALGTLRHLEVRCTQSTPDWGHFLEPLTIGGITFDLGPHAIAVALVLAGDDPVIAVRAKLGSSRPDGADDAAHIELRFASELIGVVDLAWDQPGVAPEWSAQVASDQGVVRAEFFPTASVEANGAAVELAGPPGELPDARLHDLGYLAQIDGFASVLAGRGGRVCPVGFGRAVLEIICAAYASAAHDGEAVELPFTGDRNLTPMQLWRGA